MDLRNLDLKMEPMSFDGVILSNVLDVMPKDISTTVIDDLETGAESPADIGLLKMNPYYSKEELESFEYKNAGNNIYEKDQYYEIKTGNYKLLERKICTFGKRSYIWNSNTVAGGNEPSVCLPELKVPEDSQQEAGY